MLRLPPSSITKLISYLQYCKNRLVFSRGPHCSWVELYVHCVTVPKGMNRFSLSQSYIKLHNAWNTRGMITKHGTLYKWEEPKAITPTARGSGNWEAVFSSLLDFIETV